MNSSIALLIKRQKLSKSGIFGFELKALTFTDNILYPSLLIFLVLQINLGLPNCQSEQFILLLLSVMKTTKRVGKQDIQQCEDPIYDPSKRKPKKSSIKKKVKSIKAKSINSMKLKWTVQENLRYLKFLEKRKEFFVSEQKKNSLGIFFEMALFMRSRNYTQCRSHHQKLLIRNKNIQGIIDEFNPASQKQNKKQLQSEIHQVRKEKIDFKKKRGKLVTQKKQVQKEQKTQITKNQNQQKGVLQVNQFQNIQKNEKKINKEGLQTTSANKSSQLHHDSKMAEESPNIYTQNPQQTNRKEGQLEQHQNIKIQEDESISPIIVYQKHLTMDPSDYFQLYSRQWLRNPAQESVPMSYKKQRVQLSQFFNFQTYLIQRVLQQKLCRR